MIIGDPKVFAIESCISIAYEELGARALGFFVIHIGGRCYGVREPDATWLACTSAGVAATFASNCYGESTFNRGVSAEMASSCYGRCSSGGSFGVKVNSVANFCYGFSASGTGVSAYIVNSCVGATTSGTTVGFTFKYNMP